MIERPIPFSAPMVNATNAQIKTQTRRAFKIQPDPSNGLVNASYCGHPDTWLPTGSFFGNNKSRAYKCPHGRKGDRLWVKENYRLHRKFDQNKASDVEPANASPIFYEADSNLRSEFAGKLRPSMFMTRWASRINLLITEIKAERIQEISEEDAIAEGIVKIYSGVTGADVFAHYGAVKTDPTTGKKTIDPKFASESAKGAFKKLWVSINGQASWDKNPWVWVICFERLKNTLPNPLPQGE